MPELEFATLAEIVDELDKRYEALVLIAEGRDMDGDYNRQSYFHGGTFRALGLSRALCAVIENDIVSTWKTSTQEGDSWEKPIGDD